MVREGERGGRRLFFCDVCSFGYDDQGLAEACETYCQTHGACSVEITRRARHRP